MSDETAGRDVGWAVGDGEIKPIRQVLRERASAHRKQDREQREAAFRERAFMQASLASCLCCYPLELAETASKHQAWCPSHALHESRERTR